MVVHRLKPKQPKINAPFSIVLYATPGAFKLWSRVLEECLRGLQQKGFLHLELNYQTIIISMCFVFLLIWTLFESVCLCGVIEFSCRVQV